MQSDKRNIRYIVLCALASVSMAAIAGDRYGISVYGYSTEQGYQRQIYGGGNGGYRYYQQPRPYYSPSPYGGYQPPYYRGYSEGYHDGYHQGQHQREPRHGTRNSDRRNKN